MGMAQSLTTGTTLPTGVGARSGEDFKNRLRSGDRYVTHRGKQVRDFENDEAFKGAVETMAGLYDSQLESADTCLYSDNGRVTGRAFMRANTLSSLRDVSQCLEHWEKGTFGMMGRLPTYLSRALVALESAAPFLGEKEPAFADNIRHYFNYIKTNDLCMSATLATPQINRARPVSELSDSPIAAEVVKETDAGIIVTGARMMCTLPMADEVLVYSAAPIKDREEDLKFAYIFAIPTETSGVQLLCRDTVDYGRSKYDAPLASRFEEMDSAIYFDNVLVPWENVFAYRDTERCNGAFSRSGAGTHFDHQILVRNIAKTEFLLGLCSLVTHVIGAEVFPHVYQKMSRIWVTLELMKASLLAAEEGAALDEWGILRPDDKPLSAACLMFSEVYPDLIQVIQNIGASGLVSMPTEADMDGDLKENIAVAFQAARAEAHERIPIFRLAWDASMSAFATRQTLYERYSRGDPMRIASSLVMANHDEIQEYAEKVLDFVELNQGEVGAP